MKGLFRIWRIAAKILSYGVFGLGSLILGMLVLPLVALLVPHRNTADKWMRGIIRLAFGGFIVMMRTLGLLTVDWNDFAILEKSQVGRIVVANHPSLLDIVFLMSRINQADCIVKDALFRFPLVRLVVRRLYISNATHGQELLEACRRSLGAGHNLIIFPEGTRSPHQGLGKMSRGAARVALETGFECLPVRVEVPDATGLRKGDGLFSFGHTGPIRYRFRVFPALQPADYQGFSSAIGARRFTQDIVSSLESPTSAKLNSWKESEIRYGTTG